MPEQPRQCGAGTRSRTLPRRSRGTPGGSSAVAGALPMAQRCSRYRAPFGARPPYRLLWGGSFPLSAILSPICNQEGTVLLCQDDSVCAPPSSHLLGTGPSNNPLFGF